MPPARHPIDGGPTTRSVIRVVAILLGIAGLLWLVWVSRGVLTWVAIGAFLAAAINPLVNLMHLRLHLKRSLAILIVYLLGAGAMAGALSLFVPPMIEAGQQLGSEIPGYVDRLRESERVQELDREYDLLERLEEEATGLLEGVAGPDTAVEVTQRIINGLLAFITIAVVCFLLSLYGRRLREWVLEQFEGEQRDRVRRIADRMYRVVAGYVVGVMLVATAGGLATYAFLSIAGVPFALLLAFWAGLASLIPMVGATVGGIPYIVVAFFHGWPIGVAAIIFLIVYQQIENNLFQPFIHRFTVQLNPLWIILAVLVASQVLGLVGALMAIPVAGLVQVLVQEWWSWYRGLPVREVGALGEPEEPEDPGPPGGAPADAPAR